MIFVWVIVIAVALIGIIVLIAGEFRFLRAVRRADNLETELRGTEPFFREFYVDYIMPSLRTWHVSLRPKLAHSLLEAGEYMARSLARYARVVNRRMAKLGDSLRGRRDIQNNGGTIYWEEVHRFKTGAKQEKK